MCLTRRRGCGVSLISAHLPPCRDSTTSDSTTSERACSPGVFSVDSDHRLRPLVGTTACVSSAPKLLNGLIPSVVDTKWFDTKWFESCCGKKTAAARRLLPQKDCCGKKKRQALPSRKPGVSAHVALRRNGSGLSVPTRASKTRPGPKVNACPPNSLFLLISVTPASQFLLTTRGRILVRCTNPAIVGRKALQKESSPRQLPAAGFSYFYPPGRLSQASPSPSPSKL